MNTVKDILFDSYITAIDNQDINEIENLTNRRHKTLDPKTNGKDIVLELYTKNLLTYGRLKFIIENCRPFLRISSSLIKKLFHKSEIELLNIIFEHFKFFDNEFILYMLLHYNNKIPISSSTLKQLISNKKYFIPAVEPINKHYLGLFLSNACQENKEHIVKYLVEHEANVNGINKNGETPLFLACRNSNEKLVKYLIRHGANTKIRKFNGDIPLSEACNCEHENLNIVKCLVEHGANINDQKSYYVRTPLHYACLRGHKNIVQYFVEHGADLNKMFHCSTPLHEACENGHESIVKYLVEHGADINKEGSYGVGETKLYKACTSGNVNIVKYLVEHGLYIDRESENGWTALHKACSDGQEPIVRYLVEHGTNINKKVFRDGFTPLSLARQNGNESIIKYLIEHGANI